MAQYTNVTLTEMLDFLRPDKGWMESTNDKSHEHILDWNITSFPGCVIRVYTSIHKDTATAKKCGADAIRVCAVDTLAFDGAGRGIIKSRRVHRVEGWRDNLKARIMDVLSEARKRMATLAKDGKWFPPKPKKVYDNPKAVLPAFPAGGWKFKKDRLAWVRERLSTDASFALHTLCLIYALQTTDEQAAGHTSHLNGVGFTGTDSEILSSFAQQFHKRGWLSPKQMTLLHKRAPKYARQVIMCLEQSGEIPAVGKSLAVA